MSSFIVRPRPSFLFLPRFRGTLSLAPNGRPVSFRNSSSACGSAGTSLSHKPRAPPPCWTSRRRRPHCKRVYPRERLHRPRRGRRADSYESSPCEIPVRRSGRGRVCRWERAAPGGATLACWNPRHSTSSPSSFPGLNVGPSGGDHWSSGAKRVSGSVPVKRLGCYREESTWAEFRDPDRQVSGNAVFRPIWVIDDRVQGIVRRPERVV
jgi:hypothetical protein